jgi:hypothetical protein
MPKNQTCKQAIILSHIMRHAKETTTAENGQLKVHYLPSLQCAERKRNELLRTIGTGGIRKTQNEI